MGLQNAEETIFSEIEDIALEKTDTMYDLLINKSSEAGEYQGELLDNTTGADKKSIPWMIWQVSHLMMKNGMSS